jgi:hypothetical protein
LAGMCTGLNPDFDPWREVAPFANQLLEGHTSAPPLPPKITLRDLLNPKTVRALLSGDQREWLLDTGFEIARRAIHLPMLAENVLNRAERGDLVVQASPGPALERDLRRLERAVQRLTNAVMFASFAISGAVFYAAGEYAISGVGFVLAGLALLRVVLGRGRRV